MSAEKRDVLVPEGRRAYDLKSIKAEVKDGDELWFCQCGLSRSQPFCDGSHEAVEGGKVGPSKFQVVKSDSKNAPPGVIHISGDSEVKSFCLCKCTRNTPLCDGTHRRVDLLGKPTVVQERKRKSFLKWAAAGLGAVAVGVGGFFLYRHLTKKKETQQ